jgi:undecaprenyl-diphosphatase
VNLRIVVIANGMYRQETTLRKGRESMSGSQFTSYLPAFVLPIQNNAGARWLNSFDVHIELFLNQFIGRHSWFDLMASLFTENPLLKGGVIVLLMWFVIFDRNRPGELRKDFELLLGAAFFSVFAAVVARAMAFSLPLRARPFATPSLHFRIPANSDLMLINWSSFPSDHAALFAALATGIFLVSRRAGWFAALWVAVVTCFSRMYLGIHWPTDILVGAAIGVASAQLARIPAIREIVRESTTELHRKHPGLLFTLLVLCSYETIMLFGDVLDFLRFVAHYA